MSKPDHVYQVYIKASSGLVFDAIINGDVTVQYFYGTRVESSWEVGDKVVYSYPDGRVAADGEVLAFDEPKRVEFTFVPRWDSDLEAEGGVREAWIVEDVGELTRLTVETYDAGPRTLADFTGGYPLILSGLKTLLETGEPMGNPSGS
jgi:uncharacterized protein YndB with AHSA1/START domain